jgi:predicted Zn finger-like uncharacterized protein
VPIDIQCQQCGSKFHVEDRLAGKRVKCAKCTGTFLIPASAVMPDGGPGDHKPVVPATPILKAAPTPSAEKEPPAIKKIPLPAAGNWFLQTQEGEQYGPVHKQELDTWVSEGRLDATCQVLCEGWEQWKWAEEVFPQLSMIPAAPPQGMQSTAAEEDPLASLGLAQAAPHAPRTVTVVPSIPEAGMFREVRPAAAQHRGAYHDLRVAADWLPVCSWVALGLGTFFALYSAYEFFQLLSNLGSNAPGAVTIRVVLSFLWLEGFVLFNTFLGFIGLRALGNWILLRLHKEHEDRVNSESLVKVADALDRMAETPPTHK